MDNYKIEPCPHCGGKAVEEQIPGSYGPYDLRHIRCVECNSTSPTMEVWNSCPRYTRDDKTQVEGEVNGR